MRGLWILNVRSTPTPLAIRRTVIERVMPPPRRRITTPSKTWMRSRLPSTTLAETLTVSPEAISGRSVRSWSETISSSTFTGGPVLSSAAPGCGRLGNKGRPGRPTAEYSIGRGRSGLGVRVAAEFLEDRTFLGRRCPVGQQIRAALDGPSEGLLETPPTDVAVVA